MDFLRFHSPQTTLVTSANNNGLSQCCRNSHIPHVPGVATVSYGLFGLSAYKEIMLPIREYYKDLYSKHLVDKDGKTGEVHVFDGIVKAASINFNWTLAKQWEDVKKELNAS